MQGIGYRIEVGRDLVGRWLNVTPRLASLRPDLGRGIRIDLSSCRRVVLRLNFAGDALKLGFHRLARGRLVSAAERSAGGCCGHHRTECNGTQDTGGGSTHGKFSSLRVIE